MKEWKNGGMELEGCEAKAVHPAGGFALQLYLDVVVGADHVEAVVVPRGLDR